MTTTTVDTRAKLYCPATNQPTTEEEEEEETRLGRL